MEKTKINLQQICLKAACKKEVYGMLKLEGSVYLPLFPEANYFNVSKIISGEK